MKDTIFRSKLREDKDLTYPFVPYSEQYMDNLKEGFRAECDGLLEQLDILGEINQTL